MEGPKALRILLTGAGGPAAIGVARSLKAFHTIGVDSNEYALNFAETNEAYRICPASDPDYIPSLNRLVRLLGVDFVHAQPDPEVAVISGRRLSIEAKTFLPLHQTVIWCQDKWLAIKRMGDAGVPVPATIPLKGPADLDQASWQFGKKFWVRENVGAAGKGAFLANGYATASMWVESINRGWGRFQAAEYLPGRCFTWQSLWKDGRLVASQGRERLEWALANRSISGVTGVTGVARISNDPRLDDIGERAVRAMETTPNGIFGVDMKENADGVPCVTEINIGRFFTTIEFFTQLGLNFPDLYIRSAMGEEVTGSKLNEGWMWLRSMDAAPKLVRCA